jgi:hypothetical protein
MRLLSNQTIDSDHVIECACVKLPTSFKEPGAGQSRTEEEHVSTTHDDFNPYEGINLT